MNSIIAVTFLKSSADVDLRCSGCSRRRISSCIAAISLKRGPSLATITSWTATNRLTVSGVSHADHPVVM
jgi:hypothetical protein